jgi:hypothetical protein
MPHMGARLLYGKCVAAIRPNCDRDGQSSTTISVWIRANVTDIATGTVIPLTTLGIVLPTQAAWAWWVECHFAGEAKKSGAQSAAECMGGD